jgi:hypothetical protein
MTPMMSNMLMMPRYHAGAVQIAHEAGYVVVRWFKHKLLAGALMHNLAVAQVRGAIAQARGLVEVVRDEDDGPADLLLQVQQHALHVAANQLIERGNRLVHQQDGCGIAQGQRQTHTLLYAARQRVGITVFITLDW